MARLAKSINRHVATIFGGPHLGDFANASRLIATNPHIDAVICGEADFSFPEFVYCMLTGRECGHIPGLVVAGGSNDNTASPAPESDLASLPVAYGCDNDYILRNLNIAGPVPLETIRGCREKCSYCLYSTAGMRLMPLKKVEAEIAFLCEGGVKRARICDSHFAGSRDRAFEIFGLIKCFNKNTIFSIYPDPRHLDTDYIEAAKDANCRMISFGVQSLDRVVRKRIGRGTARPGIPLQLETLSRFGMEPQIDLMFGLPGQTPESFAGDINWLKRRGVSRLLLSPLMLFPGARMYSERSKLNLACLDTPQKYSYDAGLGRARYDDFLIETMFHNLWSIFSRTYRYLMAIGGEPVSTSSEHDSGKRRQALELLSLIDERINASGQYIKSRSFEIGVMIVEMARMYFSGGPYDESTLAELIRFDLSELAMNQLHSELIQDGASNISQQVLVSLDELEYRDYILNPNAWFDDFSMNLEALKGVNDNKTFDSSRKTHCVFFAPSATIYFIDHAGFKFLSSFSDLAEQKFTKGVDDRARFSLFRKWFEAGVLIPRRGLTGRGI